MASDRLTRTQRRLVRELDEITKRLRVNYREIAEYEPTERSPRLKLTRDHLVRGEIVLAYTFIDESLNQVLCQHFFGPRVDYRKSWRTRKFRNFNYFILEKLSLVEKLNYANAIRRIPGAVQANVRRLNDLRNGVAHSFFPENLRSSRPRWKGLDVFSLAGVERLLHDLADIDDYFVRRNLGAEFGAGSESISSRKARPLAAAPDFPSKGSRAEASLSG